MPVSITETARVTSPPQVSPEEDPITVLVRRHQVMMWRYLRLLGCDGQTAEELTQETFVVLLRAGFRDRGPVATAVWLRRTAKNLWRNDRRRRCNLDGADVVWDEIAGPDGEAQGWTDAVARCLDELAPKARTAVLASRVDERSRAHIAAELGIQEEGVKTLLRRAVATLRECLERRMGHD